jgi:hypothetical protein
MPVHVDELSSEVTVVEGELSLTPPQIEKLVKLVMRRIADEQRNEQRMRAATRMGSRATRIESET